LNTTAAQDVGLILAHWSIVFSSTLEFATISTKTTKHITISATASTMNCSLRLGLIWKQKKRARRFVLNWELAFSRSRICGRNLRPFASSIWDLIGSFLGFESVQMWIKLLDVFVDFGAWFSMD
jgi:hypothetical protein